MPASSNPSSCLSSSHYWDHPLELLPPYLGISLTSSDASPAAANGMHRPHAQMQLGSGSMGSAQSLRGSYAAHTSSTDQHLAHSACPASHTSSQDGPLSPGNSPWYKRRTRAWARPGSRASARGTQAINSLASAPSALSETTRNGQTPLMHERAPMLLGSCSPTGMICQSLRSPEHASRGLHAAGEQLGDESSQRPLIARRGAIPHGFTAQGGVEPRPQRKGRHTRQLASQRQTADAAAGAYNFQRTLQELTAGLNWDPQPAAANSGHTITPPRRMPVWR